MQRQLRLRRRADFQHVRVQGRQWHHPWMTMAAVPNQLTHNRYGFVASRRLGGAVVRNRVRRLLREAVRQLNPWLIPGFDVVFLARNAILDQPYNKINEALKTLFQRANLWQNGAQRAVHNQDRELRKGGEAP